MPSINYMNTKTHKMEYDKISEDVSNMNMLWVLITLGKLSLWLHVMLTFEFPYLYPSVQV